MLHLTRLPTLAWLVFAVLILSTVEVWAQAPAGPTESLSTRYAMAYGLVGLGVILGLFNVVRTGQRKGDKPKPG